MQITIFGASGKTGLQLLHRALERGHHVIAYARTPSKINLQHQNLTIVQGDVRAADTVAFAIKGSDGVINVISPTPDSPEDLMAQAAKHIISGMQEHGVSRLIWSTGAGVPAAEDDPTLIHKAIQFLLKLAAKDVFENARRGVAVVKESDVDWTIARAPMLTNEARKKDYHVSYVDSNMGPSLTRENFAAFMLNLVESDDYLHDMPAVSDG